MDKPNYYAIIPANVRYDTELTPNAKLLYGEITALTNEKGYCWANNNYFSKLYKVSKVSISKWINELDKKGYIQLKLVYKKKTKQIQERRLYIVDPIKGKFNTPQRKVNDPIKEKFNTPIKEKFKDNNTSINNTFNNIPPIVPQNEILTETEIMFNQFWKSYPNKKAKQVAYKSFTKLTLSEKLFNEIMDKLELFKKTKQWNDPKYIPYPSTWLNQKRWEDELTEKDFKKVTTKDLDIDISDF